MLTKKELDTAIYSDYERTVRELVENCDLLLKGNRMLVENRLSEEEYQVLQEGAWESIKYGLAKLGRYKAGGKIFGKGKIDQEAGAKIQKILDKKGNEVIKKLDDTIKKENPEFPNNKEGEKFLGTVVSIAEIYDSIVASTKKNPKEEGYLPTDAANSVIADLAEYVKKFLDVDLAGAYTVMDSEEEKVEGDEELLTDEVEDITEDQASDTRAKLQAKAGDTKYDTKRMGKEGLKSNRLPMLLAGVGASLGAFSWLTNTEWFKSLFEEVYTYTDVEKIRTVIETKTQVLNDIKPGEGVYKLLGRITNNPMDGNSDPSEMIKSLAKIGGGDAHKGVDLLCQEGGVMMKPGEAAKGLHDLVNNPDQYDKLGDMFKGAASGTGKLAEPGTGLNTTLYGTVAGKSLTSILVKKLPIIITKTVTKTGVKTGATYFALKGLGGILGPIGIGLVAAGALVKIMRVKGQKQSRAKTLNDLLQSLQPVKVEGKTLPPVLPNPKPNPVEGGGEGKNDKEGLFNDLVAFFKFTHNNRKMASPEVFGDKKGNDIKVGEEYFFTNKKGQKNVVKVVSLTNQVSAGDDKKFGTDDDSKKGKLNPDGNTAFVVFKKPDNTYGAEPAMAVNKDQLSNENIMKKENLLTEGKFIKDPEVIKMLKEKSGIDANKLKFVESFFTRLEIIRNKVKKMNNTGDNVLDKFVQKLKSNPIMTKDFTKTFNVDSMNPQNVENMGRFINELIEIVYKGKFRGTTFNDIGGMINKMGKLGGGNINKVSMGESYLVERKGKKAKAKSDFKNNIISFITELMSMFQYMYKLKKQGKLSGGKPKENKPKENKPKEIKAIGTKQEESVKKSDPLLNEEINKIKNLMFRIL